MEILFNTRIKVFQSDGGGEFDNKAMISHFINSAISFRKSCLDTPNKIGLLKGNIDILLKWYALCLADATFPFKFWVDVAFYEVFTINRLPTTILHSLSPFEKLFHKLPDYNFLRVFGCE